MLDTKVLYVGGGGSGGCPGNLPQASAEIIDLAAASPAWTLIPSMKFGRRQTTAIILADGKVLVTGGSSQCGFTNEAGAVFAPELWTIPPSSRRRDPWTTMANASVRPASTTAPRCSCRTAGCCPSAAATAAA